MNEHNWGKYYEQTKENPPRSSLVRAVGLVQNKGNALDLGSGALNDTRYLVSVGFEHVTAVDKNPVSEQEVEKLPRDKVSYDGSSFEDFNFQENSYDLINAQYSLPFTSKESFDEVFDSVIKSLKPGGVFVGQFFGDRDAWNIEGKSMTFQTREEVETLLSDFKIIELKEEEVDGKTASGDAKHWHVFHFIAVK